MLLKFGTDSNFLTSQEDNHELWEEMEWALNQRPNTKAPGVDEVPVELRPLPTKALTAQCQNVQKTGQWPRVEKVSIYSSTEER